MLIFSGFKWLTQVQCFGMEPCSSNAYVYLLPFTVRKQLATILDVDNTWELLGLLIESLIFTSLFAKNSTNVHTRHKTVTFCKTYSNKKLFLLRNILHVYFLAFVMPDIGNADMRACRNAGPFESPTENLLAIWGSKGNNVTQLYNCLGRAKLVRAMKAVRHLGFFFLIFFICL